MTTPDQLAAKFERLSRDLSGKIPQAGLDAGAALAVAALRTASAVTVVPVPSNQFGVKRARNSPGGGYAVAVGWGFAVLGEYGSYHKPGGWLEAPKGQTKTGNIRAARSKAGSSLRGIERKALAQSRRLGYSKIMLGDKATGFAAAYVNHTPFKATPYKEAAAAAVSAPVAAIYDRVLVGSLASIF